MKTSRLFHLTAAVALAVVSFPGVALATETSSCAFSGIASFDPELTPSAIGDLSVRGNTSFGTFTFDADATCVKVDADAGEATYSGVYEVRISSAGSYTSFVCGAWLSLYGAADRTQLSSLEPGWQGPISAKYRIDLFSTTSGSGSGEIAIFSGYSPQRAGVEGAGALTSLSVGHCVLGTGLRQIIVEGAFELTH